MKREGNCYAVTEAAWHILGGREGRWEVCRVKIKGEKHWHWFLRHRGLGGILDLSRLQFPRGFRVPYEKAVRASFLTKQPSRKARELMEAMTWQGNRGAQ